ncbi:MAG TPA: peptide chain release factor 1 [Candidatus Saccharimonadales bacterium]|nr:peptide chain release factor 1 [Candidatus Saccharimonadales bacterium]
MDNKEQQLRAELADIESKLQDPSIFADKNYPKLAKRQSQLSDLIALFDRRNALDDQQVGTADMTQNEDPEIRKLAQDELAEISAKRVKVEDALEKALTPQDPNNDRNVIMEIRAAAGGDESSLFAGDLYRMYTRWAENHGYKIDLISESANQVGGFKEITFALNGSGAYKNLKFEAGVHRVQRIPTTESQGRVHTSTTTVAVLPEAEETDMEIEPADLRIDVFRSGGHGGQSVNTTDSAVRITHLPSGIVVANQDEKSQIKNKAKAMSVLRSRLLQMKIDEEASALSDVRKKLIGSGDRSEKIRTYNFPQDRITDHRINYSRSNIIGALDGDIDDLISKLQSAEHELISHDS